MTAQRESVLPAPTLPQAVDGALSLTVIQKDGIVVRVPLYSNIKEGDQVSTPFEGLPKAPLVQFPPVHVVTAADIANGLMNLTLPPGYVWKEWRTFETYYHIASSDGLADSPKIKVDVKQ
ncbi:Uncharacterised protein [Paucimonas lemoignei]|jgi:hypothetical protein|nr:Uncharacterised protein [Paucimonas lemoignei]